MRVDFFRSITVILSAKRRNRVLLLEIKEGALPRARNNCWKILPSLSDIK